MGFCKKKDIQTNKSSRQGQRQGHEVFYNILIIYKVINSLTYLTYDLKLYYFSKTCKQSLS